MPMETLAGSGEALRAESFSIGVNIDPHSRMLFGSYLQNDVGLSKLPRRQCTTQVGCGDAFVLPDTVIGLSASGVVFQSGERGYAEYERAGALEGWRREVAAEANGNPVLMGSISAAFMGPLLRKCDGESGGFHLVDDSSVGKSTCVRAAASVFGGPRHVRSWDSTANGMEGVAAPARNFGISKSIDIIGRSGRI